MVVLAHRDGRGLHALVLHVHRAIPGGARPRGDEAVVRGEERDHVLPAPSPDLKRLRYGVVLDYASAVAAFKIVCVMAGINAVMGAVGAGCGILAAYKFVPIMYEWGSDRSDS